MYKAVFEQSPVPCAIVVHELNLLRCNASFAYLLGYRCDELEGRPLPLMPENAPGPLPNLDRPEATTLLEFKHKGGYPIELRCVLSPLDQGSGWDGSILQVIEQPVRKPFSVVEPHSPSPTLADLAIDHIQEAVYLIGPDSRILDANKAACEALEYSRDELMTLHVSDIDPAFTGQNCALRDANEPHRSLPILDTRHRRKNGEVFPVRISAVLVQRNDIEYLLTFALDISEEQRLEDLRLCVLESLARGDSLEQSLQLIVDYVEELHPEAVASLMLVSDDGRHLVPGPSNKLSPSYLEVIRQVPIREGNGACGTAAAVKQAVRIENIAQHPYFENARQAALDDGLQSCWSDPILGADGEILGTFCIYLKVPGRLSKIGVETNARRAGYFASIALERHRAAQQIKVSQQRYRDIFDNSLDALALLEATDDDRYVIVEANPALEKIVDIQRHRIIGKTTDEIVSMPSELADRINAHYRQCLTLGEVLEGEAWFELPAGNRIMHTTMIPVCGTQGEFHRIVLISRDLTEHRYAEKLLHTREEEFRALVENSPDGIVRYGYDGNILYTNPQARAYMTDIDTLCGHTNARHFEDQLVTADRRAYREARRVVQKTGAEAHLVVRLDSTDRRHLKYQDIRFVPEYTPDGEVKSVLSVMRDITTLKETEIQLRTLIENTPNFIGRQSLDGNLLYANPALRIWMGLNLGTSGFEPVSELLPADERSQILAAIRDAVANECVIEREIYFTQSQEWHRILFVPEKNGQSEFTSVLTVGQDITRQKQIDHDLRESRTQLRELGVRRESELEAERKRIAHEIHDELGQLLTTLRLNLSMTGAMVDNDDMQVKTKIFDMTQLVDRTIQTVRNISTALRPAVLDAGIASALDWLTQEFSKHSGIRCHLTIQDDIRLDEERATVVFRVVQESLSNIGRHSGADRVWIQLHYYVTGYCLFIRDNGRGFEPETVTGHQSFGLIGMRERILSLSGRMNLKSTPGLGTTIEITIPTHPGRNPL